MANPSNYQQPTNSHDPEGTPMPTTLTRRLGTTTALLALTLTASSCGDNLNGDYISDDTNSGYMQLTVDGDEVKYTEHTCDGEVYKDDVYTSAGKLNDDQDKIVWDHEGEYEGTTPVSVSDSTISIDDKDNYVSMDSDEGKDIHHDRTEGC